jgi:DNA polymerase III gamma/tau subunit
MNLYEKYRPQTFEQVVGQDKAVRQIQRVLDKEGWGGQAFFISGPSGTGKSTLARIIAGLGADEFTTEHFDSADDLTMDALNKIEDVIAMYGWGQKNGRAIIVEEAHGLRAQTIRRLLGLLERIPKHVVWIFTTTKDGFDKLFDDQMDASPLVSRCHEIALTSQGLCKAFAKHVQTIAQAEGLDGKPISAYEQLARDCRNNCRRMLQAIADGKMVAD